MLVSCIYFMRIYIEFCIMLIDEIERKENYDLCFLEDFMIEREYVIILNEYVKDRICMLCIKF